MPAMINICKGVYTNKKMLFTAIDIYANSIGAKVSFSGALTYENKKFSYNNVQRLLKTMLVNESFALKLQFTVDGSNKTVILEITTHNANTLTL
jgi:hypothetical protein